MVGKGKMFVLKRNGRQEDIHFDKITSRIQKHCYGLDKDFVDPISIALRVIDGLYSGMTTVELDNIAAETAATMITNHADYGILAARIAVSNLHKETKKVFSDVMSDLYHVTNLTTKKQLPMISEKYYKLIQKHADKLNSVIIYDRDFGYDYIGFKSLERNYLLKINGKVVERPQHMLMRVAVAIHGEDIDRVIETYNFMSERYYIHATSTLLSACSIKQQMASSFLLTMMDDSIEGIYDTLMRCELVNESKGEIGVNVHCIRAKGTSIARGKGVSSGLVPMLRVYDEVSGPISVYLEVWHSDIFEYLELKKRFGKDEFRARELSCALWIPDLFMERAMENDVWSLMCPHKCPGLIDAYGDNFKALYTQYEKENRYVRQIPARELWFAILRMQYETGTPYIVYKDHCNRKSNQQNLGTIKCSSNCTSVVQYSSSTEVAACSLASIAVNMFVNPSARVFDFEKLKVVTELVTRNLNKIIDVNCYPLPEAEKSSRQHRPIGIGVQGLADAFLLMRYPFESEEAQKLNIQIFETLYYGALEASCELAKVEGTYPSYKDSPISKGILQYDMWKVTPTNLWDWDVLKAKIATHGIRNSVLIAQMPTTSCSEILGNSESVQPYTSNIDTRRVPSGEIHIINRHLLKDLTDRNLWNADTKNEIITRSGFIQNIKHIPEDLKSLYKTAWEIPQKTILKMAVDRGAFIDQSQSTIIHMAKPTTEKLTSMHFYTWKNGLKTGMYQLRTEPITESTQINDDNLKARNTSTNKENGEMLNPLTKNVWLQKQRRMEFEQEKKRIAEEAYICSRDNGDACMSCGS